MCPYLKLKESLTPILQQAGMREISEELQPDVFGSAYSIFSNEQNQIRLIWDGKDGYGFAQCRKTNGQRQWEDIPIHLTEDDLEGEIANQERIDKLCAAVVEVAIH